MRGSQRRRGARRALLLVAFLAVGAAACGGAPDARPRNLVLISVDTLRPDLLGAYGYGRPTSPAIDALAGRGVLFETALTTSPWTLPAHGSLLTGLYPSRHGMESIAYGLPREVATLAELLRARGFATAAFVNSRYLDRRYGWQRGFDVYESVPETPRRAQPSEIGDLAIAWLREEPETPFFLFLHYYDVHSDYRSLPAYEKLFVRPYEGPLDGSTGQLLAVQAGGSRIGPAGVRYLRDRYAASIRQLDDGIAQLLSVLDERGYSEDTLVVLTSDHGEEFLEHGSVLHGRTHYEEVMRVPLVLVGPGIPAGVRVRAPVSLVDVLPTALGRLGVPPPPDLDGLDLAPLWTGGEPPELTERALFGEANHTPEAMYSARTRRYKLILDEASGEAELYDLASDPGERHNAVAEQPEVATRLRAELGAFMRNETIGGPREPLPDLGPDEIEALRRLGYLDVE